MDSLEYMGVSAYTNSGVGKKTRELTCFEDTKYKINQKGILNQMQTLVEADLHPYAFGIKIRDAVVNTDRAKSGENRYFEEPQGRYLWRQRGLEGEEDAQLKIARMEEMKERINEHKRRESQKEQMLTEFWKSKEYLSNNLLMKKMRTGRMRYAIDKLRKLEAKMKKLTGIEEENLKKKVEKLQESTLHDLILEQRKTVGVDFWKPLFTSED